MKINQTTGDSTVGDDINVIGAHIRAGIAVIATLFANVTLNQAATIVTIVYVVLQIGLLLPKYRGMYLRWKRGGSGELDE